MKKNARDSARLAALVCAVALAFALGAGAEEEIALSDSIDADALRAVRTGRAYVAEYLPLDTQTVVSTLLDGAEFVGYDAGGASYRQEAEGATVWLNVFDGGAGAEIESGLAGGFQLSVRPEKNNFERESLLSDLRIVRSFLSDETREKYAARDLPFLPLERARERGSEILAALGVEAEFVEQMAVSPAKSADGDPFLEADAYVFYMA